MVLSPENLRQKAWFVQVKSVHLKQFVIVAKQLYEQSPQEQETMPAEQCEKQKEACFESLLGTGKIGQLQFPEAMGKARESAFIEDRTTPMPVFLQLETPIGYDSEDHREVDLIFALFIPPELCDQYTQELPSLTERN